MPKFNKKRINPTKIYKNFKTLPRKDSGEKEKEIINIKEIIDLSMQENTANYVI